MAALRVRPLESIGELRRESAAWDDLWQRSAAARPTARAEQLAIWHECFGGHQPFRALVVERDGQLVAALPFTMSRRWGIPLASSLGNAWSPGSELLLDVTCDAKSACAEIVDGLERYMPGLLWLDGLLYESEANRILLSEFETEKIANVPRRRFTAPLVHVNNSWPNYLASRSRNLRRQLRTITSGADKLVGIEFQRCDHLSIGEVEPVLRSCFELEAGGWKGRQSSAVLNDSRAWRFFLHQALELAQCGQLAIALLRHGERIVAFEYGWQSNGVRGVLKIGYDESLARLSPGQLLRVRLLEQLFAENEVRWVDFVGPTTRATGQWATHSYEVGRTLAAIRSRNARMAVAAYRAIGRLRGHSSLYGPTDSETANNTALTGRVSDALPTRPGCIRPGQPRGRNLECNVHPGIPKPAGQK
jgi:CelD/BcsL family acetyltransferase involved in cellulose biosynthesis